MGMGREKNLIELPRLPTERLHQSGMAVAVQHAPPARSRIVKATAGGVGNVRPLGTRKNTAGTGVRNRREGVPDGVSGDVAPVAHHTGTLGRLVSLKSFRSLS